MNFKRRNNICHKPSVHATTSTDIYVDEIHHPCRKDASSLHSENSDDDNDVLFLAQTVVIPNDELLPSSLMSTAVYDDNSNEGNITDVDNDESNPDAIFPSSDSNQPQREQIQTNRLRMTLVHYIMTYPQWSIALFIYFASLTTTTIPMSTIQQQIWEPLQNLRAVVQTESQLFFNCIQSKYHNEKEQFNVALRQELHRVETYRTNQLQPQMDTSTNRTRHCTVTTNAVLRAVQTWHNTLLQQIIITVPEETNHTRNHTSNSSTTDGTNIGICSEEDHQAFMELLLRDTNAIQNDINRILDQYMINSLHSIAKVVSYSQERSLYDYNYFIGIKVQSTLQLLNQFVLVVPSINITLPQQHQLLIDLRTILQDILDVLHGAHLQINTLTLRLQDFETSIAAFHINYVNLYTRFDSIHNFVLDFVPHGIPLPGYFDISDLPLPNTLLPINYNVPNFNANLPDIDILANNYIEKALVLISGILKEVVQITTELAHDTVQQLIESIRNTMTLEDYNPPRYASEDDNHVMILPDEIDYITKLSSMAQSDIKKLLDSLYKQRGSEDDYVLNDATPSDLRNVTLEDNNPTEFTVLDVVYPELHVPHWILSLMAIVASNQFVIECMMQAYRLRALKRKYERNASPDLPNIDYSVQAEHDNNEAHETARTYRMNVTQMIVLKHLLNPWVVIGLVLFPFIVGIFAVWFPHIKTSCIDSRRGTFLARNVWKQININRANSRGYALRNLAQVQCFQRQWHICNTQMMLSDSLSRSDLNTLHTLQTRFNDSKTTRDVIDRCVDSNAMDVKFNLHCCGLEGYATDLCQAQQQSTLCPIDHQTDPPSSFRPIGGTLLTNACDVYPNFDEYIENASFNCSNIQRPCTDVPCTSVDENLIEMMTIEADCRIEVYCVQVCIFLAISVYHAIVINLINRLLFNGILQIQWKKLKPDGILLITSIDGDGHLMKGEDQEERAEFVHRVMKQYVRTGYVQVALGVTVFLFWIVSLFLIRRAASHVTVYRS
jgi:hypothetical protein